MKNQIHRCTAAYEWLVIKCWLQIKLEEVQISQIIETVLHVVRTVDWEEICLYKI